MGGVSFRCGIKQNLEDKNLNENCGRDEWEASLPNVGLSKTLRIKAQSHFWREQYLIGERFVPPTSSSAHSQNEQYLIGERFVLPTITHTMVHPFLGQVLIRQGWEAFLPNVGLNKFVRVTSIPRPIFEANNT